MSASAFTRIRWYGNPIQEEILEVAGLLATEGLKLEMPSGDWAGYYHVINREGHLAQVSASVSAQIKGLAFIVDVA